MTRHAQNAGGKMSTTPQQTPTAAQLEGHGELNDQKGAQSSSWKEKLLQEISKRATMPKEIMEKPRRNRLGGLRVGSANEMIALRLFESIQQNIGQTSQPAHTSRKQISSPVLSEIRQLENMYRISQRAQASLRERPNGVHTPENLSEEASSLSSKIAEAWMRAVLSSTRIWQPGELAGNCTECTSTGPALQELAALSRQRDTELQSEPANKISDDPNAELLLLIEARRLSGEAYAHLMAIHQDGTLRGSAHLQTPLQGKQEDPRGALLRELAKHHPELWTRLAGELPRADKNVRERAEQASQKHKLGGQTHHSLEFGPGRSTLVSSNGTSCVLPGSGHKGQAVSVSLPQPSQL